VKKVLIGVLGSLAIASFAFAAGGDAPEISRSVGKVGGVVVLWPRVIPPDDAFQAQAVAVQQKLKQIAAEAMPSAGMDVRPSPERVCQRTTGCKGVALSAIILHKDKGCALVASVSPRGQSDATLVPWAGKLKLLQPTTKFREPPEDQLQVIDFSKCDAFLKEADVQRVKLIEAVKQAAAASPQK
jgi:hypothetical protein